MPSSFHYRTPLIAAVSVLALVAVFPSLASASFSKDCLDIKAHASFHDLSSDNQYQTVLQCLGTEAGSDKIVPLAYCADKEGFYRTCMDGSEKLSGDSLHGALHERYALCSCLNAVCQFPDRSDLGTPPDRVAECYGVVAKKAGPPPAPSSSSSSSTPKPFMKEQRMEHTFLDQGESQYDDTGLPYDEKYGTVNVVGGDATIRNMQSAEGSNKLSKGTEVGRGDIIATGHKTFVYIKLKYGMVALGPDSELLLTEFASTSLDDRQQSTWVHIEHGYVKARKYVEAIKKNDSKEVTFGIFTDTNLMSVRYSAMVVYADKDTKRVTLYVTEDQASVSSKKKGAKAVIVKEGYKVTMEPDGTVGTPQKFSAGEFPDFQIQGKAQADVQKEKVIQTPGKPSKTSLPPGFFGTPAPSASTPTRLPVVKTEASAEADGYPAKNATDDSPTSMWVNSTQTLTTNNNAWISLDFGSPKHVQKLKWLASVWEKPYPSNGPSKYRVQRSDDGQAWMDVGGVVDLGIAAKDPRQFTGDETFDVTTRYLRLKVERVNDGATGWSLGLKDFWAEGAESAKNTPATLDKQACLKQYDACIAASRKLPGPLLKKGSPMNNAWAECTRKKDLCR